MRGNQKNAILGVISIICFVVLVVMILRSGRPEKVQFTGEEIKIDTQVESELSEEQVKTLAAELPRETPIVHKPSALQEGERQKPKMANTEIAKIQAEAVRQTKESAMAARTAPAQNLSPEQKARIEQIQEMRKKQAEKKKR